ncbi:hypothetical protein AB1Y20_019336 [Prymnesium parvum]|uniref:ADP,ATP carrier protein n=1 Tax=Prymnesium parvum TaxID=97485 RepID=A0AB34JU19_PRYPA
MGGGAPHPARRSKSGNLSSSDDEDGQLLEDPVPAPPASLLCRRRAYSAFRVACGGLVLLLLAAAYLSSPPRPPPPPPLVVPEPLPAILAKAGRKALGGGLSGAAAGVVQVVALMWLRTTMNYQYRYGSGMCASMRTLYADGGVRRFYQGLPYALLQTPLSRFGDTAANSGVLALLAAWSAAAWMPVWLRTACASGAAALWRMLITPLDTLKTTLQVEGAAAYALLIRKARLEGVCELWAGALANAAANFVGGYPWFLVFNAMDEWLPRPEKSAFTLRLLRSASLATCATCVSDVLSNSIRVVKTTRQTAETTLSYTAAAKSVLATDGLDGLFCRGLGTRLLANILQASLFTIVWKQLEHQFNLGASS